MLPAVSLAVHCTTVTPTGKNEPDAGVQLMFVTGEQRSLAVADANVTTAPHWSESVFRVISDGQMTVGGVASKTVTAVSQELDKPKGRSLTVRTTRVIPSG